MAHDLHTVCSLLDKLTLDSLTLTEELIQLKLNLENSMCGGESHLAKSRYILGQNNVSSLQLPTENSPETEALTTVQVVEQIDGHSDRREETRVISFGTARDDQIDPVRWFGYLVPQDLYHAQTMFKQALNWAVGAVNVQSRLRENCDCVAMLKNRKRQLLQVQ